MVALMTPVLSTDQRLTTQEKWALLFGASTVPGTDNRALLKRIIEFANGESDLMPALEQRISLHYSRLGLAPPELSTAGALVPLLPDQPAAAWAGMQLNFERLFAQDILRLNIGTFDLRKKSKDPLKIAAIARLTATTFSTSVVYKPELKPDSQGTWQTYSFSFVPDGPLLTIEWLNYMFALLRGNVERLKSELCQCHLKSCGRFFLKVKPKSGRPRTKFCCDKCMFDEHAANSTIRSRNSRAGIRQEDRASYRYFR